MSVNINVNNVDFSCVPMIKEGFNGQHENIAWMCNDRTVENFELVWNSRHVAPPPTLAQLIAQQRAAPPPNSPPARIITDKSYYCGRTLPSVPGSQVIKDGNFKCRIRAPNNGKLTPTQCNTISAAWEDHMCLYPSSFGCDTTNGWFNMTSPDGKCGKN